MKHARGWQPERDFSFTAEVFVLAAAVQESTDVDRIAAKITQRGLDRAKRHEAEQFELAGMTNGAKG